MATITISEHALRVDGPEKVSGAARYSADVRLPGLLVGAALRSPVPHARIVSIDVSAARALPGVRAVLTAADLPPVLLGKGVQDIPPLARERVRFVGERVAVVAAETRDIAEQALGLIAVEYDELPAVLDPEAALHPDAPVLHPDRESYQRNYGHDSFQLPQHPNASSQTVLSKGDVTEGLARSARLFEDEFHVPMQHVGHLETHSCTVAIDPSGKVRVWSCVKQPFGVRQWMAHASGLPQEQIVTMPALIGGDFGGKGYLVDEPLAYFLARASGRPVQMVMTQNEAFLAGIPRHAARVRIKSGVDEEGRLLARQVEVVFNNGAYAGYRPRHTLMGIQRAAGCYRIPNVQVVGTLVYTNQVPCGHMRAPGQPQVAFAVESHTDLLARRLGQDPVEFRRRNLLRDGDEGPLGATWNGDALEVLERAVAAIGWGTTPRDGRGLGLAVGERGTGGGRSEVSVEVDRQGRVLVRTGVPEVGTGAHTVLRQVAANVLSLDPAAVEVVQGDTESGPFDSGSGGSKVTNSAGGVTLTATAALRARLCALAAEVQGWGEDEVDLEDGAFVARGESQRIPFAALAGRLAALEGGVIREGAEQEGARTGGAGTACHAVEVSVDGETGQVRLERMVVVQDVGRMIHPVGLTGQIEGGLVQALGMALVEELRLADGRVQSINFGDYKIPSVADIPPLEVELIENGDGPGPFGGKGVGEITAVPTMAAIANAVDNAIGVRICDLPVTSEKIFKALRARQSGPD